MEPLRELDVNCLASRQEPESSSESSAAKEMLARIDRLGSRGSWKVRDMREDEQYVVLEADWYEFRSHLDRLAASLVQVTKTAEGTGILVLCARLNEAAGCWHWLRIRLNRLVSSQLRISVPHRVSADSRSVVLPEATFTQLRQELLRNCSLTWRCDELPAAPPAPPAAPLPAAGPLAALPQTQAALQTQELHLTKTAVTYLIGPAGERIESTRLQSQATIKVLPISARETRPRSLPQTLALTGDRQQIATAMALIEAQLTLHHLAPNHQL